MGIRKIKRDMLIEKAAYFFRTQGFHGTSMQEIADSLGVNKASLYHHIIDKENLGLVTLQALHRFFQDKIFSLAYDEKKSPAERLSKMTEELEHYFLNSEGGCLMANFALELGNSIPSFAAVMCDYLTDWMAAFSYLFKTQQGSVEAEQLAREAVARYQGALIQHRLGHSEVLLRQRVRLLEMLENPIEEEIS